MSVHSLGAHANLECESLLAHTYCRPAPFRVLGYVDTKRGVRYCCPCPEKGLQCDWEGKTEKRKHTSGAWSDSRQ